MIIRAGAEDMLKAKSQNSMWVSHWGWLGLRDLSHYLLFPRAHKNRKLKVEAKLGIKPGYSKMRCAHPKELLKQLHQITLPRKSFTAKRGSQWLAENLSLKKLLPFFKVVFTAFSMDI